MQPGIKWAVEYPAALVDESVRTHDFSDRTTSPPFESKGAAEEHARALMLAYRNTELFLHTDGKTVASKPLYKGSAPPASMQIIVKPVIA